MGFLAPIGIALGAGNAALGAYGALQSAHAQSAAAKYNAAIATENANVEAQNAQIAGQAGAQQAGMESMKGRAALGELKANQAAGNVDVNSGSAVSTQMSERELSELDALTVRSNATKQAYGYEVQSENQKAQAALDTYEAQQDIQAGNVNAVSTFLGSASSTANKWARFQMQSGVGSG